MTREKPFAAALDLLWPGATGAELVSLFDERATVATIANWRAGRRNVPLWARDRLQQRIREKTAEAESYLPSIPVGPGLRAGAKNLAIYLARRT